MQLVSIDVGLTGGIAKHGYAKNQWQLEAYMPMPVLKKRIGKAYKLHYDFIAYYNILKQTIPDIIIIEKQIAMPNQSIVAMFHHGFGYGGLTAIAETLCNVIHIEPREWKKYYGLSSNKIESINLANKMYDLSLKKSNDGIAEAILIGQYYISTNLILR